MLSAREGQTDRILELLGNIHLFSSLTNQELRQIVGQIVVKTFKKGDVILSEEDANGYMYIILSGKVKVIQTTENGKEIALAMHRAGEFFGELALIDNKTAPATVLTLEESIIAVIARKDFYSMIYSQGKVLETLLQIFCSRLRDSWGRIQLLSLNNASQRIRLLLFQLADEYGGRTLEGTSVNIRLTHQDIADMVGIARETVTRVIDRWRKDGEIEFLNGKYILLREKFYQCERGQPS